MREEKWWFVKRRECRSHQGRNVVISSWSSAGRARRWNDADIGCSTCADGVAVVHLSRGRVDICVQR